MKTNKNKIISFITECLQEFRKTNTSNAEFNSQCTMALAWLADNKKDVWFRPEEALPAPGGTCLVELYDLYYSGFYDEQTNKFVLFGYPHRVLATEITKWADINDILAITNPDIEIKFEKKIREIMKEDKNMPYSLENIKWKVGETVHRVNYNNLKLEQLTIEKIEVVAVKNEIVVNIHTIDENKMRLFFSLSEFDKWFAHTPDEAIDKAISFYTNTLNTLKKQI